MIKTFKQFLNESYIRNLISESSVEKSYENFLGMIEIFMRYIDQYVGGIDEKRSVTSSLNFKTKTIATKDFFFLSDKDNKILKNCNFKTPRFRIIFSLDPKYEYIKVFYKTNKGSITGSARINDQDIISPELKFNYDTDISNSKVVKEIKNHFEEWSKQMYDVFTDVVVNEHYFWSTYRNGDWKPIKSTENGRSMRGSGYTSGLTEKYINEYNIKNLDNLLGFGKTKIEQYLKYRKSKNPIWWVNLDWKKGILIAPHEETTWMD